MRAENQIYSYAISELTHCDLKDFSGFISFKDLNGNLKTCDEYVKDILIYFDTFQESEYFKSDKNLNETEKFLIYELKRSLCVNLNIDYIKFIAAKDYADHLYNIV